MGAAACLLAPSPSHEAAVALPSEVAGIALPTSAIARKAISLARQTCPAFLFNHCMRTFLFGALTLKKMKVSYAADTAFVAAALHDLGLLPAYASPRSSFEIDGADAAEKFMLKEGVSAFDADKVWHAVEMHDGKWALTKRQGPEAMLVSLGAGTDVDGPDPGDFDDMQMREILTAFQRLAFKKNFTALLEDHCRRKPASQRATWLEGLCRDQRPDAFKSTVESEIAASSFDQ